MQIIEVFCVVGIVYMVFRMCIDIPQFIMNKKHTERYLKLNPEIDPIAKYILEHKEYLCKLEDRVKDLENGYEISLEAE